jgi:hypothetical protein
MQTDLAQSTRRGQPAVSVKRVSRLAYLFGFYRDILGIGFRQSAARRIVMPVHRTGFVAMQVCPIASESDKVPHRSIPLPLLYSRGSAESITVSASHPVVLLQFEPK